MVTKRALLKRNCYKGSPPVLRCRSQDEFRGEGQIVIPPSVKKQFSPTSKILSYLITILPFSFFLSTSLPTPRKKKKSEIIKGEAAGRVEMFQAFLSLCRGEFSYPCLVTCLNLTKHIKVLPIGSATKFA